MAGYQGPKNKIARRFGVNLWGRVNNPLMGKRKRNAGRPGKKKSEYALQLDEKQKLRYFYGGIREKQFNRYYKMAKRRSGNVGTTLLELLEQRLDTTVYRFNLAPTIFSSRQLVSHGHIMVNGKRVDVPSFQVKPGDEITMREKTQKLGLVAGHVKEPERKLPAYLTFNTENFLGRYERTPERTEIIYPFELNESLIIEYYSR